MYLWLSGPINAIDPRDKKKAGDESRAKGKHGMGRGREASYSGRVFCGLGGGEIPTESAAEGALTESRDHISPERKWKCVYWCEGWGGGGTSLQTTPPSLAMPSPDVAMSCTGNAPLRVFSPLLLNNNEVIRSPLWHVYSGSRIISLTNIMHFIQNCRSH